MRGQPGFFDVDERLKDLSAKGDALERLNRIVDFELFRDDLARAVPRSDGSKLDFGHLRLVEWAELRKRARRIGWWRPCQETPPCCPCLPASPGSSWRSH